MRMQTVLVYALRQTWASVTAARNCGADDDMNSAMKRVRRVAG